MRIETSIVESSAQVLSCLYLYEMKLSLRIYLYGVNRIKMAMSQCRLIW
jgi:hypothetical protein